MRPVRVGFLTYGLDRPLSGVTRVALELGRALADRPECDVVFLTPYRSGPFAGQRGARSIYLPGCRLLPTLMALGGPFIALAARAARLDVVHDPVGIVPFTLGRWAGRFARLATLHDAIAFENPRGYPLMNNVLHRLYVPRTVRNVDHVATVSRAAAASLRRHLPLGGTQVSVIPSAASSHFAPVEPSTTTAVANRLGAHQPYFLYVGAFKQHKNLTGLLRSFALARRGMPNHRLVLAGPSQWQYPELDATLDELGLGDAVTVLGYVAEADLPALYTAATAFVLPSFHEGFGLPVLEAMACGTPVICSNRDALPEVAADAALMVDPTDLGSLAEAMVRAGSDPALVARLREAGLRRAAEFTWSRTAREYAGLYVRLAG